MDARHWSNIYLLIGLLFLASGGHAYGAILVQDDFTDGNANGWTVVKDSTKQPAWSVVNGVYQQSNDVGGVVQSFHRGTYAFYSADNALSFVNYRLTAQVKTAVRGSIGVLFRYTNNNNYYRFTINRSQGFAQLERKKNGSFKPLAANGRGPAINQFHTIGIEVVGSNIFVFLDGEGLFAATDSTLGSGSVALFATGNAEFDEVTVETISPAPRLIISKPVSYFVETTGSLAVAALARGVPAGGGVRFALDNQRTITDLSQPYSGTFTNVAAGNHIVSAVIVDGSSAHLPLADPAAEETNVVVGARGKYFVGFGDSITNGFGDETDAASADGRNAGRGGYTPLLNDLLTANTGLPITVFNEGFGGTESGLGTANGLSRLNSTKVRHPESNFWLVLFGTNDSKASVPSGKGLQPGNPGYAGTYKDFMQRIVNSLMTSGKTPVLAKVPFAVGVTAARDQLIRDYNVVVDELVAANNLPVTPPDFYTYFKQHQALLPDGIHPNGAGYEAMADLWLNALLGSGLF
jgi:lysophospholipase L1-like esterase